MRSETGPQMSVMAPYGSRYAGTARPTASVDDPNSSARRGMIGAIMNAWKNTRNVAAASKRSSRSLSTSDRGVASASELLIIGLVQ